MVEMVNFVMYICNLKIEIKKKILRDNYFELGIQSGAE